MQTIAIILVLLLALVFSGYLARILPVPRPLIQIALGGIIGFFSDFSAILDPKLFFFLFLPPLLFLDGWRIPKEGFRRDLRPILGLALGLVVFTVLGAGLLIHWMIPVIPLPVAFALAAVISPTDPIAVSAIAQRVPIPPRMMHILEGESLLNDASGLVCLRFAVAAMLTGAFSAYDAALEFVWVAVGGIVIGAGITWGISWAKAWLARYVEEDSGSEIIISLLIPFGSYLIAEHFGCSGILAAVASGMVMNFAELTMPTLADTRVRSNAVWDMIQFAANGVIFVLLGEQLPGILGKAAESVSAVGHQDPMWLLFYVLVINAGLAALRFMWVYVSFRLALFRNHTKGVNFTGPQWRVIIAMSFAGVRGAITLAGVLTLPYVLLDGSPFPARDLAMGVIIVSLIVASIGLPLLLKGLEMPHGPVRDANEMRARVSASQAAIAAVEHVQHRLSEGRKDVDTYAVIASRIMDLYRGRIEGFSGDEKALKTTHKALKIEREMRLAAFKAERAEIQRQVKLRKLSSDVAVKLIRDIDLLETRYTNMVFTTNP